jgi:hypothetical protein
LHGINWKKMSRRRSFDPTSKQATIKPQPQAEEPIKDVVNESSDEDFQDVKWVAKKLKMEIGWVYAHASGKRRPVLHSHKFGRYVRFLPSEVMEFAVYCSRNRV